MNSEIYLALGIGLRDYGPVLQVFNTSTSVNLLDSFSGK